MNRSSAGAVVTYFLYQRNANGAPTRVTHEDGTFTYYQYDALDRLTQEHRVTNPTVYGFQYEYDQASRRTSRYNLANDSQVLYSLDTRGLLREENEPDVDITTYEWDNAQRLVTRTGLTTATSYAHDQRDQVKEFTLEGFGSGTNHQFHYTGLGERVVMVGGVGGTTPTYLAYDGGRLVTERGAGGTNYQALRWSPKGEVVDELDSGVGSAKAPVSDAQGSVGRLPGVAGGRIYDAFGVEWASSLSSSTRAAFLPGAFLRLNSVPYQIGLTRGGLYLAAEGMGLVGPPQLIQLGLMTNMLPGGPLLALVPFDPSQITPDEELERIKGQGGQTLVSGIPEDLGTYCRPTRISVDAGHPGHKWLNGMPPAPRVEYDPDIPQLPSWQGGGSQLGPFYKTGPFRGRLRGEHTVDNPARVPSAEDFGILTWRHQTSVETRGDPTLCRYYQFVRSMVNLWPPSTHALVEDWHVDGDIFFCRRGGGRICDDQSKFGSPYPWWVLRVGAGGGLLRWVDAPGTGAGGESLVRQDLPALSFPFGLAFQLQIAVVGTNGRVCRSGVYHFNSFWGGNPAVPPYAVSSFSPSSSGSWSCDGAMREPLEHGGVPSLPPKSIMWPSHPHDNRGRARPNPSTPLDIVDPG